MPGLAETIQVSGSETFYTDGFKNELEYHLSYIIARSKATIKHLAENDALRYEGDFYGLCCFLKIPQHYIWITLRVNGYRKYEEFSRFDREIIIPDASYVDELEEAYSTSHKTV